MVHRAGGKGGEEEEQEKEEEEAKAAREGHRRSQEARGFRTTLRPGHPRRRHRKAREAPTQEGDNLPAHKYTYFNWFLPP